MNASSRPSKKDFRISKWFLDFLGPEGKVLIAYVAHLSWQGITVPYTSILWYDPATGISQKSRFTRAHRPEIRDNLIEWADTRFSHKASWEARAAPVGARLYESEKGYLDWECLQPHSKVTVVSEGEVYEGEGYAEVLHMTFPTWEMPMDELRWGHVITQEDWVVWIEVREDQTRQWVWWNGKMQAGCLISDSRLYLPEPGINIILDQQVVLEEEKKISKVVRKLVRYLPGFSKIIPESFLMADQFKWASKAELHKKDGTILHGRCIHEFVNFNPSGSGTES